MADSNKVNASHVGRFLRKHILVFPKETNKLVLGKSIDKSSNLHSYGGISKGNRNNFISRSWTNVEILPHIRLSPSMLVYQKKCGEILIK